MSVEDQLYPVLGLYQSLPDWMQWLGGRVYRALPRRWRWGAAYGDFQRLAAEGETWSRERMEEYQFKQLRKVLIQAGNFCPFYQQSFARAGFRPEGLRSVADLADCPSLKKSEVLKHRDEMVSTALPKKFRLYLTTGGSTGVPVGFYLHKGVSRPKEQAFLEAMWRRAGSFEGARLAVIRGHVTSDQAGGRISSHDATRNWLMLSSYHLTQARLPEYLAALEKFKPDLLHAYPSAALQLAEFLDKAGQTWRLPLRGLLCGSERLTLPQKRLLERVFHCRVYRWYGHSERVVLAGEGRTSEWFYFWPQYGFVEFGPPDAEGLREVIGTSFHNLVMPLIRYHTGDFVKLAGERSGFRVERSSGFRVPGSGLEGERSSGFRVPGSGLEGEGSSGFGGPGSGLGEEGSSGFRVPSSGLDSALPPTRNPEPETRNSPEFPWPAAVEIVGREQEFLVSGSGRRISLTAFNMHDAVFDDLYAVQFYQEAPGRAEFRYVPGPRFHRSRLDAIETGIRRKLGDDFQIEMREVTETEKTARGKHRWLVSKLV